jgi:hypothetical protein
MKYCMAQNYKEVNGDYGERQAVGVISNYRKIRTYEGFVFRP